MSPTLAADRTEPWGCRPKRACKTFIQWIFVVLSKTLRLLYGAQELFLISLKYGMHTACT